MFQQKILPVHPTRQTMRWDQLGTWHPQLYMTTRSFKNRDAIRIITMEFPQQRPVDHKKNFGILPTPGEFYASALDPFLLGDILQKHLPLQTGLSL